MIRCPKCNRAITVLTNNCHRKNPIFECAFGLRDIAHMHFWCGWCVYSWVEVRGNVDGLIVGSADVARRARAKHVERRTR